MEISPRTLPTLYHVRSTGIEPRVAAEYIRRHYAPAKEPEWVKMVLGPRRGWEHWG